MPGSNENLLFILSRALNLISFTLLNHHIHAERAVFLTARQFCRLPAALNTARKAVLEHHTVAQCSEWTHMTLRLLPLVLRETSTKHLEHSDTRLNSTVQNYYFPQRTCKLHICMKPLRRNNLLRLHSLSQKYILTPQSRCDTM